MSVKIISQAWELNLPHPSYKLTLIAMADCANHDGVCWPSIATLSKKTSLSKATIKRAIKFFEQEGIITKQNRNQSNGRDTSNLYVIFPQLNEEIIPPPSSPRTPTQLTVNPSLAHGEPPLKRTVIETSKNHYMSGTPDAGQNLLRNFEEKLAASGSQIDVDELTKGCTENELTVFVLAYLNFKCKRDFKAVRANLDLIKARLKEGYLVTDLMSVVGHQARKWGNNSDMVQYLRPKTLFNATNCAQYSGQN